MTVFFKINSDSYYKFEKRTKKIASEETYRDEGGNAITKKAFNTALKGRSVVSQLLSSGTLENNAKKGKVVQVTNWTAYFVSNGQ